MFDLRVCSLGKGKNLKGGDASIKKVLILIYWGLQRLYNWVNQIDSEKEDCCPRHISVEQKKKIHCKQTAHGLLYK